MPSGPESGSSVPALPVLPPIPELGSVYIHPPSQACSRGYPGSRRNAPQPRLGLCGMSSSETSASASAPAPTPPAPAPGRGSRFGGKRKMSRFSSSAPAPEPPASGFGDLLLLSPPPKKRPRVHPRDPVQFSVFEPCLPHFSSEFQLESRRSQVSRTMIGAGSRTGGYVPQLKGCRNIKVYDRLNMIDRGAYGVVSRARSQDTGDTVAVKRVLNDTNQVGFPLTSLREINILQQVQHTNIVQLVEIVSGDEPDEVYMVMEYMEHDMRMLMNSMKTPFQQAEVKCLLRQLLSAMEAIHRHWFVHRDLKTPNLLYNDDGILKVCDFGLARHYSDDPEDRYTPGVVTLYYRAPEILLGATQYTTAVDMWSVGCIFAEFLTKDILMQGKGEFDQLYQIFQLVGSPDLEDWPEVSQLPHFRRYSWKTSRPGRLLQFLPRTTFSGPYLSEKGHDLLSRLLTLNPKKRISAAEALQHPYWSEAPRAQDPGLMPTFPSLNQGSRELLRGKNAYEISELREQMQREAASISPDPADEDALFQESVAEPSSP